LLMGMFENEDFVSIGTVGTGFSAKMQTEIIEKLKPLEIPDCPFREIPEFNKPTRFRPNPPKAEVVWVKPEMVAEISYRTVGSDGTFRHPSFKGLREDKNANDVVKEKPMPTTEVLDENNLLLNNKIITTPGKKQRRTLLNPSEETQVREIGGYNL